MHNYFKKKKRISSIKNNVIKCILYVRDYIILTFDFVHLSVMISDIHNGVIMANVGH